VQVLQVYEDIVGDVDIYQHVGSGLGESVGAPVAGTWHKERRLIPAGSFYIPPRQPLGAWLPSWLEPQSPHNLVPTQQGERGQPHIAKNYPVWRLSRAIPLWTGPPPLLAEERTALLPITDALLLKSDGSVSMGFQGAPAQIKGWLDAEHFLQVKENRLWKVHARSGQVQLFADPDQIAKSLRALSDIPAAVVHRWRQAVQFHFTPDHSGFWFELGGEIVLGFFDGRPARRLTRSGGHKEFVTFSPDGRWMAFVRGGNLFVVDVGSGEERPLTRDGGGDITNGKADWVYEEEVFLRQGRAFWWCPQSRYIAFLQFDDRPVRRFTITRFEGIYPEVERYPYPKAGEANPLVRLGVVQVVDGRLYWLDLPNTYPPQDTLIVRVGWRPVGPAAALQKHTSEAQQSTAPPPPVDNPNGYGVYAYVQNRTQTWLDLLSWDDWQQPPRRLLRETTPTWVDDPGEPHFLPDGSFLFLSERSGWKHLYHYAADGRFLRRITHGAWDIQDIVRVDASQRRIYFTARIHSPTGVDFCMVPFDGPVDILSEKGKTHHISLAPQGSLYIDRYSDPSTPAQQVLAEIGRGVIRRLDINPAYHRQRYQFGKHERVRIPLADGFILEAAITYPPRFDSSHKYPVWLFIYGGPRMPTIRDDYSAGRVLDQSLATSGIVVVRVDPRSASGKGAQSAWSCYKKLGVQELQDLEGVVQWLIAQGWADPQRIGLSGHSYGGYLTAYALTHSRMFAAGIASGPVTDWRLYDTIYTERYMLTPQENQQGYEQSSCLNAAAQLHGRLLLIHGMIDDNVHVQNSLQFAEALQKANKQFEMMVYPSARHGIPSAHYWRLQLDFIRRSLGVPAPAAVR
jgi:dipeptidyl-peptidase-4